ncbi:MAG: hypothetical protein IPN90_00380 [Elusimicrobia bacterium]|nr:hypothetical protein [Elusimicrobiota bacterium]
MGRRVFLWRAARAVAVLFQVDESTVSVKRARWPPPWGGLAARPSFPAASGAVPFLPVQRFSRVPVFLPGPNRRCVLSSVVASVFPGAWKSRSPATGEAIRIDPPISEARRAEHVSVLSRAVMCGNAERTEARR